MCETGGGRSEFGQSEKNLDTSSASLLTWAGDVFCMSFKYFLEDYPASFRASASVISLLIQVFILFLKYKSNRALCTITLSRARGCLLKCRVLSVCRSCWKVFQTIFFQFWLNQLNDLLKCLSNQNN